MKLEIRNLEKTYRSRNKQTQALTPTSFTVGDAEFVSLVGPSGCGKSTTLFMIAGLDQPTGGQILLDGQSINRPGRDRGMVLQNYTLFPWLTVRENARFAFELADNIDGQSSGEILSSLGRADSLLDLMGLESFYDAFPSQLSGGMKQRVAISRALAARPKVLLMDEPFGALDAHTREEMQELLLLLSRHERTTTLFVTHDVEEAIYLSTRILVFSGRPGRVIREITVPFGPERVPDIKLTSEFVQLKREILHLLNHGQSSGSDRAHLLQKLVQQSQS
jgi:NitT/TauT family transport system ATP-binding protein